MGCGTSFTAAFGNFTAMRISARIGQQDADDCNHNIDISYYIYIWVFPKIGNIPKCMVKIMENPIKVDDLGVPLFSETSIYSNLL